MDDGILQQCAPAIEVFDKPGNVFVGGFIGSPSMNFLEGEIVKDGNNFKFQTESVALDLPDGLRNEFENALNKQTILGIRPTDIHDKTALPWLHLEKEQAIKVQVDFSEKLGMENFVYSNELLD